MSEFINTIEVLGDEATMDAIIERTITEFKDDTLAEVGEYAFYGCTALTTVDLPNVTKVSNNVFEGCSSLVNVNLPALVGKVEGTCMFLNCTSLQKISLPSLTNLSYGRMFDSCTALEEVYTPKASGGDFLYNGRMFCHCTSLRIWDAGYISSLAVKVAGYTMFSNCNALSDLILRYDNVVPVTTVCFNYSSLAVDNSGVKIYVPRVLVSEYENATNWCDRFAAGSCIFLPLEDYTVDGTTSGELDETKI